MGPRAVRISAEEFVIPEELAGFRLAEHSTGQVGGVRLALRRSDQKTVFGSCFQQVPLRVLPPFQFPDEPASLIYLLNPTAGLLDGDGHLVEIHAGQGACAVVTGQSANRIHPAVKGFATQQWRVQGAAGSQLVILPGPNIPFRGSRYYQRAVIELADDARLIWGDIWTPGRYRRPEPHTERYDFDRIVQHLEIHRDGMRVYRDHFAWDGPWDEDAALWYLGGSPATGTGSLFITGNVDLPPLGRQDTVQRVRLTLASGDTLIRWCGPVSEVIANLVASAFQLAARWNGPMEAPAWLIGSNHLAPSHWFSSRP